MKKLFYLLVMALIAAPAAAQQAGKSSEVSGGMLRYPDVSSKEIVFSYAGNLWIVSRAGGTARPLASPPGREVFPRFSPDGKSIAFVGNYEGSQDLYTISAFGGVATRRTFHPGGKTLCDWTADGRLVYSSNAFSGLGRQQQLLSVTLEDSKPTKLPVPYGTNASISSDGKTLAYTPHSRDGRSWKRYRGGMASDVWLFGLNDKKSKQITDWEGTDSLPMFFGKDVFYLSDNGKEQRLNIWKYDTKSGQRSQITTFSDFDCKWPSIGPGPDGKGEIVLQNGAHLWLVELSTGTTSKVSVKIPGDRPNLRRQRIDASKFIQSGDVSPSGKRIALAARGDIWSVPVKNGVKRNLTPNASSHERTPCWSPDGQWIAYFSDKSGEYQVYRTQSDGRGKTEKLTDLDKVFLFNPAWSPDSKFLTFSDQAGKLYLHEIGGKTKVVDTDYSASAVNVSWSHDSKWMTYSIAADNRVTKSSVWVYELATGKKSRITDGFFEATSPTFDRKGKYLYFASNRAFNRPTYEDLGSTFIYNKTEVLIAVPLQKDGKYPSLPKNDEEEWGDKKKDDKKKKDADKGKKKEESKPASDPVSGTWDLNIDTDQIPEEARNPKATFKLAKNGSVTGTIGTPEGEKEIEDGVFDPSTGELSFTVQAGVGEVFFLLVVEKNSLEGTAEVGGLEIAISGTRKQEAAGKEDSKQEKGKEKNSEKDSKKSKKAEKPLKIDLEGISRRAFQLPVSQGGFRGLQVNDKNQLVYARTDGEKRGIYLIDVSSDKPSEKSVVKGATGFGLTPDGKKMIVSRGSSFYVISAAAGQKLSSKISTSDMITWVRPKDEWKQILTDAWRIQRDFFYDPTMHGVDWKKVYDHYLPMIDDCSDRSDVGFVISEMIAELNVGHAYYRGPRSGGGSSSPSAKAGTLGCTFVEKDGAFQIGTIFEGAPWDTDARNPLRKVAIKEGDFLLAINDVPLKAGDDPYRLLQGTAGVTTLLTISKDNKLDDKDRRVVFKPMSNDSNLRFRHWIETKRKMVEKATDGKVGYVYVINTGVPGQNDLIRQLYGQLEKEALIIDDRWNGGGQIPTRFIELLNRPVTNYWARRHGRDWTWPRDSHQGPKCMLINGMAGSGGDMFPKLFRQNKLGKLIGRRTWGGLVGITGYPSFVDGSSVTAPNFAYYDKDGTWGIEGHGVDPDIDVIDDPAKMIGGGDPQLEAGIKQMLKELKENPYKAPKRPAYPDRRKIGIAEEDK